MARFDRAGTGTRPARRVTRATIFRMGHELGFDDRARVCVNDAVFQHRSCFFKMGFECSSEVEGEQNAFSLFPPDENFVDSSSECLTADPDLARQQALRADD